MNAILHSLLLKPPPTTSPYQNIDRYGLVPLEWNGIGVALFPPSFSIRDSNQLEMNLHIFITAVVMDGWMVRWALRREVAVVARLHS